MTTPENRQSRDSFDDISSFDAAMRQIVAVPKEAIDQKMAAEKQAKARAKKAVKRKR